MHFARPISCVHQSDGKRAWPHACMFIAIVYSTVILESVLSRSSTMAYRQFLMKDLNVYFSTSNANVAKVILFQYKGENARFTDDKPCNSEMQLNTW